MPALACRLDATPAPGGIVRLAFTLSNGGADTVALTYFQPLTPSRLRAWVGGAEVSVAIPPTSLQEQPTAASLEPGEELALPTPVYLRFDPEGGYGAGEDMFCWALVSEPGPLEIEAAIGVEGANVEPCRAQVEPVA